MRTRTPFAMLPGPLISGLYPQNYRSYDTGVPACGMMPWFFVQNLCVLSHERPVNFHDDPLHRSSSLGSKYSELDSHLGSIRARHKPTLKMPRRVTSRHHLNRFNNVVVPTGPPKLCLRDNTFRANPTAGHPRTGHVLLLVH